MKLLIGFLSWTFAVNILGSQGTKEIDSKDEAVRISFRGLENHEHHTKAILANLMDPRPVTPSQNGSIITFDRIVEKVRLHIPSDDVNDDLSYYSEDFDGKGGANINLMKKTMTKLFSKPRSHDANATYKAEIHEKILDRLSFYTGETMCQEFQGRDRDGTQIKGSNVIGILPGKLRGQEGEGVIVVGAHWDTVSPCPGIDDNGSGMVALLETARLLSPRMGSLNHTVIFVAFDLEELGILGSIAFVNNYLIPKELTARKSKFIGAYIMDMVLNYDPSTNAQILPRDISRATPDAAEWVRRNNHMGDFVAVWSRKKIDFHLWYSFETAFREEASPPPSHKILVIDPPIPRLPLFFDNYLYRSFLRSDHAAFWNHKNRAFKDTLNAVLITDMGPWRGVQRACYHEFCDDSSQLTTYNLEFLKHIVDALAKTIVGLAE